ncbi:MULTISPECIES: hypothetical protein [unclassified Modestobacter]
MSRHDRQRLHDVLAALEAYVDTTHAIVASTVAHDLPGLRCAVGRLRAIADDR